jgi:hypothetical protein
MLKLKRMMYISGSFSKAVFLLLFLAVLGKVSAQEVSGEEVSKKETAKQEESDQDTLRTFGPRIGIDLAPFIYYFTKPKIVGAEVSVDFEIFRNLYPVIELGYSSTSESEPTFDYESLGNYGRFGVDYNVLPVKDRSWHNTMTVGFRYGISLFKHSSDNVLIYSDYWGDYMPEPYESSLTAHWLELIGGIKVEIVPNLALGWLLRYKFLLNQDMDPNMIPALIPGYGNGADGSAFGFSYSIFYMIPLIKK